MGARCDYSTGRPRNPGLVRCQMFEDSVERHRLLMAVGEATQRRRAVFQLSLADDGCVGGAKRIGVTHLRFEGALSGGDDGDDPLSAEVGGEAERLGAGLGGLKGDERARPRGRVNGHPLACKGEDYTLDAGGEAGAGRPAVVYET